MGWPRGHVHGTQARRHPRRDVAGYSRMMELDEAGTFERLKACWSDLVEPAIASHRGSIFKLM
jgi:class 3 adenylate cyclase